MTARRVPRVQETQSELSSHFKDLCMGAIVESTSEETTDGTDQRCIPQTRSQKVHGLRDAP